MLQSPAACPSIDADSKSFARTGTVSSGLESPALPPLVTVMTPMRRSKAKRRTVDLDNDAKFDYEDALEVELLRSGKLRRYRSIERTQQLSSFGESVASCATLGGTSVLRLGPRYEALATSAYGSRFAAVSPGERRVAICDVSGPGDVVELSFPKVAEDPTRHVMVAFLSARDCEDAYLVVAEHPGFQLVVHLHVWDLRDVDEPYRGAAQFRAPPVDCLALAPSTAHFVLGGAEGMLRIWNLHEAIDALPSRGAPSEAPWVTPAANLRTHARCATPGDVTALAFSRTGERLAAASSGDEVSPSCVRVWLTTMLLRGGATPAPIAVIEGMQHPASALAFSPDGARLASAHHASGAFMPECVAPEHGVENAVFIWAVESNSSASPALRALPGRVAPVNLLRFAPDGRRLLAGSTGSELLLYDAGTYASAAPPLRAFRGTRAGVNDVAFTGSGRHAVVADADAALHLWHVQDAEDDGEELLDFPHDRKVQGPALVTVGLRGEQLVSASALRFHTWAFPEALHACESVDPQSGQAFAMPEGELACLCSSSDGRFLATASWRGDVQVRHGTAVADGDSWFQLEDPRAEAVVCLAFAPNGGTLATGGAFGTVRLWDASRDFQAAGPGLPGNTSRVAAMAFLSGDGMLLAAATEDGYLRVWDRGHGADIGRPLQILSPEASSQARFLAAVPAMRILASASAGMNESITLWRVTRGGFAPPLQRHRALSGTGGVPTALTLSPDANFLALAVADGAVRVWTVSGDADWAEPVRAVVEGGGPQVTSLVFTSTFLAWACRTGDIHVLRMARPSESFLMSRPGLRLAKRAWFLGDIEASAAENVVRSRAVLQRFPPLLRATSRAQRSFLQAAVAAGRVDVLRDVQTWSIDPENMVAAVLAPPPGYGDRDGDRLYPCPNGAFHYAAQLRDDAALVLLLGILEAAFARAFRQGVSRALQRTAHSTDDFHHSALCAALRNHPHATLAFLKRLKLVEAYDFVTGSEHTANRRGARLLRGSEERSPPSFWSRDVAPNRGTALDIYEAKRLHAGEQRSYRRPVADTEDAFEEQFVLPEHTNATAGRVGYLVPLCNVAGLESNVLEDALAACEATQDLSALASPALESLIEFKWRAFARGKFRSEGILAIGLVFAFTLAAVGLPEAALRRSYALEVSGLVILGLYLNLWTSFLLRERRYAGGFHELWRVGREHYWRGVTLLALGLTLVATCLLLVDLARAVSSGKGTTRGDFIASTIASAFALPVAWYGLARYLATNPDADLILRTQAEAFRGTVTVLTMLILSLCGFAASFHLMFVAGADDIKRGRAGDAAISEPVTSFDHLGEAFVSTFDAMLGGVPPEDLAASTNEVATTVLFVAFRIFVTLVLLSLLVGVLSGVHAEARRNARVKHLRAKARVVLDYERDAKKQGNYGHNPSHYPKWLQVLQDQTPSDA